MTIAKANSIKKGEAIIEHIEMIIKDWEIYAEKAKVKRGWVRRLESHI